MDEYQAEWGMGKVGFVTIVGRPNVGKSTFLNQVLKYHLAAVSSRPNTTRKRWLGILSDDESQIIFADTPGVHESKNKMHEAMAKTIKNSISRNDLVLAICDASREFGDEDTMVCEALAECGKPVVFAINKVDKASKSEIKKMKESYLSYLGDKTPVHEISASDNVGVDELLSSVKAGLPEGP
ncbi:MAG: GTPase Era, partial [Lentisphaeraceae bacterium]|nr:GTPase Era [Lentisphaeraceae bacterium]